MGKENQNTKPKILFVESNDLLRNDFRDVFEKYGYYFVAVDTAKEGYQIL